MEPGILIDQLYTARAKRLKLDKAVDAAKAAEKAISVLLLAELTRLKLESASGKIATVSYKVLLVPEILKAETDWPLLYAYIKKHGTFEMLHKRLSTEPFTERWARGETVPGVSAVSVIKLNLSARKK